MVLIKTAVENIIASLTEFVEKASWEQIFCAKNGIVSQYRGKTDEVGGWIVSVVSFQDDNGSLVHSGVAVHESEGLFTKLSPGLTERAFARAEAERGQRGSGPGGAP